jgi:hypothetical protein
VLILNFLIKMIAEIQSDTNGYTHRVWSVKILRLSYIFISHTPIVNEMDIAVRFASQRGSDIIKEYIFVKVIIYK